MLQSRGLDYRERNEIVNYAVSAAINNALDSEEDLYQLTVRLAAFAGRYSASNIFMILHQMPEARFCQSKAAWAKDGYPVYAGQEPLLIMSPITTVTVHENGKEINLDDATEETRKAYRKGRIKGISKVEGYKYIHTYDISQTNAPASHLRKMNQMQFAEYEYGYFMDVLAKYAKESMNVDLQSITEYPDLYDGYRKSAYYFPAQGAGTIYLNPELTDREAVACFLRELTRKFIPEYDSLKLDIMLHNETDKTENLKELFRGDRKQMLESAEAEAEFKVDFIRSLFMLRFGIEPTADERQKMYDHFSDAYFDDAKDFMGLFKVFQSHCGKMEEMIGRLMPEKKTIDVNFAENVLPDLKIDINIEKRTNNLELEGVQAGDRQTIAGQRKSFDSEDHHVESKNRVVHRRTTL